MAEPRIRVLLVEDNPDIARLMRAILGDRATSPEGEDEELGSPGFEVESVASLERAKERLTAATTARDIDVVLLDLSLPDSHGIATIEAMQAVAPHIPKIVLTASDDEHLAVQAVRAGAQDYLTKVKVDGQLLSRSIRYAIERQRAREVIEQHNRTLLLLNWASRALTASLDLEQVLARFLEETRRLLDVAITSVWLVDPITTDLVCQQSVGPGSEAIRGSRLVRGEGFAGWAANTGQSLVVPDAMADERHYAALVGQLHPAPRSVLSVPLRSTTKIVGVLEAMDDQVDRFGQTHVALLELLATTAATAITNAQLYQQARQDAADLKSRHDELDAFAHTVAHDLKNPLTTIISFASLLEEDLSNLAGDGEAVRCAQYISESAHKMLSIIEELLLLAGIRQRDVVDMVPLEMGSVVSQALRRLAPLIQERGAKIMLPAVWPAVLGHGPWVEEVWVNYISNAIRHGGTPPAVEVGAKQPSQGMTVFYVQDNGHGIAPEDQERLFTPFTRLNQVSTKGHGLGLSIVRRIVERMGGRVGVVSKGSQGSIFYFTLPGQTEQQPP